jgi:hypothetical protein
MPEPATSDSPIFIVGCARSGTTLLRDLLRSHPHLTFPGESYFIPIFFRSYPEPRNAREASRLAARILGLRWIRDWRIPLSPDSFVDCRSYREIICRLYQLWAGHENKPRWGDKTPSYALNIPVLLKLFPRAKVIHIYRDGRDVALSWMQIWSGPRSVFAAARLWRDIVRTGRRFGATLPPETYLEVRYETLIQQPVETMKTVCAFVGEPFCEAVLHPNRLASEDARKRWTGSPGFKAQVVTGNLAKWRTKMSVADRGVFESVAGDLLASLGYETEGLARRVSLNQKCIWNAYHFLCWWADRLRYPDRRALLATSLRSTWAQTRRCLRPSTD